MIIDRTHSKWALGSLIALVLVSIAYFLLRPAPGKLVGGTALGITLGVAGFVLMLIAGLLGAREKVPAWRIGRLQSWMRAHLWLGLLSFPIIFMHGGMVFGHGLTRVLMILFTIVVVSGVVGAAMQHFMPRRMTRELPMETTFEQIDRVCEQLVKEGEDLIASLAPPPPKPAGGTPKSPGGPLKSAVGLSGIEVAVAPPKSASGLTGESTTTGSESSASYQGTASAVPPPAPNEKAASAAAAPVKTSPDTDSLETRNLKLETSSPEDPHLVTLRGYWEREVLPYLQPRAIGKRGPTYAQAQQALVKLRMLLPAPMHDTITAMQEICAERAQLAEQRKLHYWLHGWLFVHVPLSYALLLLAVVHAVDALRY